MKVTLTYSKTELKRAVEFISTHNENFLGEDLEIKEAIFCAMHKMARDPDCTYIGTMGFMVVADREIEDMDSDENVCRVEILVDPALGDNVRWDDGDLTSNVIDAPSEVWHSSFKEPAVNVDGIVLTSK